MAEERIDPREQRESLSVKEYAEARKADAEAARYAAEARYHTALAEQEELKLRGERREEEERLLGDKYYHLYTFGGEIGENSVNTCIRQLTNWVRKAGTAPLKIEIIFHSPGGEVIAGMALFDFIRSLRSQGHHITTTAMGMAASMAGILLQAGDVRVMGREAWVLIHEIQFGAMGSMGEVEDRTEHAKRIQRRILSIFAERCNLSVRTLARRWKRKDWWLSSDECLKYGFVDEVR